ncbi:hypothetical protein MTR67_017549 [Solanum verrucosum]|uniref:Uncharacterized protein n=1 Tax=Solanum verrucosum TaxID=315347 RepID=A0AAF0QI51_SOLVR|nr:hypothetical protein MTR67_017549 [Solanum verrucosum]
MVMEGLQPFSSVTGLVANMDKSHIFMARVDEYAKSQLLLRTRYVHRSFPIRYLVLRT